MKRVLQVTLSRNDNRPDNRVLRTLDVAVAHGFKLLDEPMFRAGVMVAGFEWRCIAPGRLPASVARVVSRNCAEALAALAAALGQDAELMAA